MLARGVSPTLVHPLAVTTIDVATPQSRGALLLSIAPYFIIFSIFLGGMYLAIDSTAGERERSSLEPLLINPLRRSEAVLGKLGATLIFTFVAVVETLLAFWVVLNFVPLERFIGIQPSLELGSVIAILGITVPIMFLAAILQILVATFTRSFKEAQTYLSLLPLAPALPGIFLVFLPVKVKLWMMAIPTFGQQLLMIKLMRGEAVEPLHVVVTVLATLALAALLLLVTVRLYQRESVVFGR